MTNKNYHHGSLEKVLLDHGLKLLNDVGLDGFSMRKVAERCGVSHTAPYRHYKNREALISAITERVSRDFMSAVDQALEDHIGNCREQITEVSKLYVKFMVENPEHFKFIFMTDHQNPLIINMDGFVQSDRSIVTIFHKLFRECAGENDSKDSTWFLSALSTWSLIHGYTTMLVNKTISFDGDYLPVVSQMLDGLHWPIDNESRICSEEAHEPGSET